MRETRVSASWHNTRRASALACVLLLAFAVCFGPAVASSAATDASSEEATTASDDDETTSERRHGTISVTCDAADDDDVIELEVGETADIVIAPYTHLQWLGCAKLGCPDQCEDEDHADEGLTCFYQGFGCVCDGTKVARSVDLSVATGDADVVSAADVVVDSSWINGDNTNFSDKTRPVTKNGTVTLTALEAGTTTVTVDAQTCEDASAVYYDHDTTLIVLWYPMSVTYTVVVTESEAIDIDDAVVTLPQASYSYTGSAIEPEPSVTYGDEVLVLGEDYTLSYADNVDAGTASVTVTGTGAYTGSTSISFEIEKAAQALAFESGAFELHVGATGANALSGAVCDVTWESSDEDVATVASDGTLTALEAGTVTITATAASDANHDGASASFELTVTAHSYVGVVTAPTCEEAGYTTWTCSVCAASYTADETEALGHAFAYESGTWEWASDYTALYGVFCANDASHWLAYQADVSASTEGRIITYTAVAEVEGETYTDTAYETLFSFTDVAEGSWYAEGVYALFDAGYVNGYTDTATGELTGTFGVGDSMTRAQLATIIWRIACPDDYAAYEADYAANDNAYSCANASGLGDVADDRYYTAAVNWAVEYGVVTGYTSGVYAGMFRPNDPITFEQMCLVVARYCSGTTDVVAENSVYVLASFNDGASVSSWAAEGVAWCVEEGLVGGYTSSNTLVPAENVARERVATVLYRGLELLLAVV